MKTNFIQIGSSNDYPIWIANNLDGIAYEAAVLAVGFSTKPNIGGSANYGQWIFCREGMRRFHEVRKALLSGHEPKKYYEVDARGKIIDIGA